MKMIPLLLAVLFVAGVHGHGWLSFPESRNSRLNSLAPVGLQYNRMNGNGRAAYLPKNPGAGVINQPGEHGSVVVS
jgi:predicted carbohydrate-binding protein with CBM5 and CBM33 domain